MPGSRLTEEERRRIADWLAEGLGYAEIARHLGRPTSTISREVARNSDRGGYRADRAQRTAGQRARRRRPAGSDSEAEPDGLVRGFVDELANLLAGTGMPRMAARVFGCLVASDSGSLTAAELVDRLRVSPASVSKAIGYLEAMELVVRQPEPGGRRERYLVPDDVWLRAWRADTGAHTEVARAARRGAELVGADTPAGRRLGQMGEFFAQLSHVMDGSGLSEAAVRDALTVVAALVYAARPLSRAALAKALAWPRQRVAEALDAIDQYAAIADPLTLRRVGPGAYTVAPRPDRLTPPQRAALAE